MIGIFDSGLGGLSFVTELEKTLPQYSFSYIGDHLRVPYGGRSKEAIQTFTEQGVQKLWKLGAKIIIIACNTASAEALRYIQQKYPDKKVLGILIPAVEQALETPGHIGVIATRATVSIGAYPREIEKRDPGRKVFQQEAPLLVPFIEEGMGKSPECRRLMRRYLRSLKNAGIQTLVLGCTHYPLIEEVFRHHVGARIKIINSGKAAAEKLKIYFENHPEIEKNLEKSGEKNFYTTDKPENFEKQMKRFYSGDIRVQKICLTS
ncbi:glutamate racemase [Candidatus Peregrinibacteria bacterium]|nr:MAG: glutamate racemase [Candidatus Peregrinibacteria bacterium]